MYCQASSRLPRILQLCCGLIDQPSQSSQVLAGASTFSTREILCVFCFGCFSTPRSYQIAARENANALQIMVHGSADSSTEMNNYFGSFEHFHLGNVLRNSFHFASLSPTRPNNIDGVFVMSFVLACVICLRWVSKVACYNFVFFRFGISFLCRCSVCSSRFGVFGVRFGCLFGPFLVPPL